MGCEKNIGFIRDAVDEALELVYYGKKAHSNSLNAAQYKVLSIDGEKIPEDYLLLICFEDTLPVDSPAKERGTVDYNWRDFFGIIEIAGYKVKTGFGGRERLITDRYVKEKYTKEGWEKRGKIGLKEILK